MSQKKGRNPNEPSPPPNDLDAEAAVLSAIMLDPSALDKVLDLRPHHFYSESHRRIFEAALSLKNEGKAVDNIQIGTRLRAGGRLAQAGGMPYLTELLTVVPATSRVSSYAETVLNAWRLRETIHAAERVAAEGRLAPRDLDAYFDRSLAAIRGITDKNISKRPEVSWSQRWGTLSADTFSKPPPPRDWLIKVGDSGVFPCGLVGMLAAEGGAGKTMALVQLALAVTTGHRWLETFDVPISGRVLLVLAEEDRQEVERRMYNAGRAMKLSSAKMNLALSRIAILPLAGVPCPMIDADGQDAAFLHWLREKLTLDASPGGWRFIGFDPLSRLAGPDAEKDNAAGTRFVQALESIATQTGAGVIVAHHTTKASRENREGVTGAARGATSLTDGARWVATMTVEHPKFGQKDLSDRLGRVTKLSVPKSNYSQHVQATTFRYDSEHGGALVPLSRRDSDEVARARTRASRENSDGAETERAKSPSRSKPSSYDDLGDR